MKIDIKVPEMGESVNEAVIGRIIKPSGSLVRMDEEIVELETDKVNQVLAAPKSGLLQLTVKVDDRVRIGQVIGTIEVQEVATEAAPAPKPIPEPTPPTPQTGPGVRYTQEAFLADLNKKEPLKELPKERSETRQRMTTLRQTIAKRLVEAQHEAAMLTTFNEVDMSAVMNCRKSLQEAFQKKHGVKLGFMSWFVKGCVAALKDVPALNSYIDGTETVHRDYYDIGVAVGTERGLMVPVIRDCDRLSFAQIEQAIVDYASKARKGTIAVDDLRGGGFTITNGGVYGSLLSTPILNAPQSGILGMHAIQQRPVAIDGKVEIRPMMYLALSYDHRIVDGEGAVTFLVRLKHYLENPITQLLDL